MCCSVGHMGGWRVVLGFVVCGKMSSGTRCDGGETAHGLGNRSLGSSAGGHVCRLDEGNEVGPRLGVSGESVEHMESREWEGRRDLMWFSDEDTTVQDPRPVLWRLDARL